MDEFDFYKTNENYYDYYDNYDLLKKEIFELHQSNTILKNENIKLKEENKNLYDENETCINDFNEIYEENINLKNNVLDLQQKNTELENKNDTLEDEIHEYVCNEMIKQNKLLNMRSKFLKDDVFKPIITTNINLTKSELDDYTYTNKCTIQCKFRDLNKDESIKIQTKNLSNGHKIIRLIFRDLNDYGNIKASIYEYKPKKYDEIEHEAIEWLNSHNIEPLHSCFLKNIFR